MSNIINLVPNRIDRDPSVILGVTGPEVYAVAWLSLPAFVLLALLAGFVFSSFMGALFAGFLGAIVVLFGGILLTAKIKRNKPPHFLTHSKLKWMGQIGFKPTPFLHQSERFRSTRD